MNSTEALSNISTSSMDISSTSKKEFVVQKRKDSNYLAGSVIRLIITTTIWIVSFITQIVFIPTMRLLFLKTYSEHLSPGTKEIALTLMAKSSSAIQYYQTSETTSFGNVLNIIMMTTSCILFIALLVFQMKYIYDVMTFSTFYFCKYSNSDLAKEIKDQMYNICLKKKATGKSLYKSEERFYRNFFKDDIYLKRADIINVKTHRYDKKHTKKI